MGVVYEAEDTVLKRPVAIKVLPQLAAADPESLQRFLREAQAAARLNHPHAVTVYEVGQTDGVPYLAMELVRGGSIQDYLDAHGRLPWPEAPTSAMPRNKKTMAIALAGVALVAIVASTIYVARPKTASPRPGPPTPAGAAVRPAAGLAERIPHDGLSLPMGGRVEAIAFSPDGKWLAAGCLDGEGGVRIWDLATGQTRFDLWLGRMFRTLVFAPDSQTLAAGGTRFEGRGLRLWSVRDGGQRALATEAIVRGAAFDRQGRVLAAGLAQRPPGGPSM